MDELIQLILRHKDLATRLRHFLNNSVGDIPILLFRQLLPKLIRKELELLAKQLDSLHLLNDLVVGLLGVESDNNMPFLNFESDLSDMVEEVVVDLLGLMVLQ